MKNLYARLLSLFLLLTGSTAFGQVFDWAAEHSFIAREIDTDQFGNTFHAGHFIDSVVINNTTYMSAGGQDVIISKFDANDNYQWSTRFGGATHDYVNLVYYDGNGNVWAAGTFSNTINIGPYTFTSAGNYDIFVVQLDAATGNILNAVKGGSTGDDQVIQFGKDPQGNVYLAGTYMGNFNIGSQAVTGAGSYDVFVVKFNPSCTPVSSFSIKGPNIETTWCMHIDVAGNIYVGGFCTSATTQFGSTPVNTNSHFVAKFNSAGVYQWRAQASLTGEFYGLCTDAAGSVFLTGNFDSNASFGPFTINGPPNDEILLAKINSNGNWAWAKSFGGAGNDDGSDLDVDVNGDLLLNAMFQNSFSFGNNTVNAQGGGQVAIVKLDTAGTDIWAVQSFGSGFVQVRSQVYNASTGDLYICGSAANNLVLGSNTLTMPAFGSMFYAKLSANANAVTGKVFRDFNNDGAYNGTDNGMQNVFLSLNPGASTFISSQWGNYSAYAPAGTYNVSIPYPPLYHTLTTPAVQSATFAGNGQVDTAHHFGFYPMPGIHDLRITSTPITLAKPNYALVYDLTYENAGTDTVHNATIDFTFDNSLIYVQSSQAPVNFTGSTLTYSIGSVAPQAIGSVHVIFTVPGMMMLNTPLASTAVIDPVAGDNYPSDNTSQLTTYSVGPYDPNYKEVNTAQLTPNDLSQDPWLEYTIHFQNVGNAPAVTVVVQDSISQNLILESMQIMAYSHPVALTVNGQRKASFTFQNINLIDSLTDPIASCGFVKYRIKPVSTLPPGSSIPNFAAIYFDYNPAIITNTAQTDIVLTVQVPESGKPAAFTLAPVPSQGKIMLHFTDVLQGPAQISVVNMLGQEVYNAIVTEKLSGKEIDLSDAAEGVYVMNVKYNNTVSSARVVIRK